MRKEAGSGESVVTASLALVRGAPQEGAGAASGSLAVKVRAPRTT